MRSKDLTGGVYKSPASQEETEGLKWPRAEISAEKVTTDMTCHEQNTNRIDNRKKVQNEDYFK